MRIVYTPDPTPKPKPPSWWRTFGKPTGTIVEHKDVRWVLVELHDGPMWSYSGRGWKRTEPTDSRRCPSWLPKDPSVPNARRKPCVLPAGHVEPCRVGRLEPTDCGDGRG